MIYEPYLGCSSSISWKSSIFNVVAESYVLLFCKVVFNGESSISGYIVRIFNSFCWFCISPGNLSSMIQITYNENTCYVVLKYTLVIKYIQYIADFFVFRCILKRQCTVIFNISSEFFFVVLYILERRSYIQCDQSELWRCPVCHIMCNSQYHSYLHSRIVL